jgi:hypothetical protein
MGDSKLPKSLMPRIPFFGATKKEEQKWKKQYNEWADENSHLSNLKTAEQHLQGPRVKSQMPFPPQNLALLQEVQKWKKDYTAWREENLHLKEVFTADEILSKIQKQLRQRAVKIQQAVRDIDLQKRIKVIEQKLDKLLQYFEKK